MTGLSEFAALLGSVACYVFVFLTPADYSRIAAADLLREMAKGRLPLDHDLIVRLESQPEEAAAAIAEVGLGSDEQWRLNIDEDLVALARHLRHPDALPYLLALLEDEEPVEGTFEAVAAIGAPAREPLLEAYDQAQDDATRANLAFALAALGVDDQRIARIVEATEDDSARALYASRGEPRNDDWQIRAEYPERGLPVAEVLTIDERFELLESPLESYRILGAASLFHEKFSRESQDALLALAQADPSPTVRAHCWQALDLALDREEVVELMMVRLRDPNLHPEERGGLLVGLHPRADRPEVRAALRAHYEKPDTRLKALEAMWRSLEPEFAPYFPQHLDDPDVEIRRVALRGIGTTGQTGEIGRVRQLLSHPELREDALFAYAMISPGKPTAAFLQQVYSKLEREAGGFSEDEDEVVRIALDERLRAAGKAPVFSLPQNISAWK